MATAQPSPNPYGWTQVGNTYTPTYSAPMSSIPRQSVPSPVPAPAPMSTRTVLGANTYSPPMSVPRQSVPTNTAITGGGNTVTQTPTQAPSDQQSFDPYSQLRNDISGSWDSYINSLDQQLDSLGGQRMSQESIANSQFNQGVNTLDLNRDQGMTQLAGQRTQATQNQAKSLNDLASNLRNSFQAGNIYLGTRGAGDSSAANQYAYALTKMGSKQRTDITNNTANILNDISGRETNLTNIYNTEKKNLQESLNQQIQGIAQWFASAQQTIQAQKVQGQLGKSQDLQNLSKDILNQALSSLQSVQQAALNRQTMLDQWATNNATNLSQLKSNLQAISSPAYQLPTAQSITGAPQMTVNGGVYVPTGYGSTENSKRTNQVTYPFALSD